MRSNMIGIRTEHPEYDNEPVFYCKHCLSLRIRSIPSLDNSDYCDECGSTDIELASILDWEKLYIEKYKHSYLENY